MESPINNLDRMEDPGPIPYQAVHDGNKQDTNPVDLDEYENGGPETLSSLGAIHMQIEEGPQMSSNSSQSFVDVEESAQQVSTEDGLLAPEGDSQSENDDQPTLSLQDSTDFIKSTNSMSPTLVGGSEKASDSAFSQVLKAQYKVTVESDYDEEADFCESQDALTNDRLSMDKESCSSLDVIESNQPHPAKRQKRGPGKAKAPPKTTTLQRPSLLASLLSSDTIEDAEGNINQPELFVDPTTNKDKILASAARNAPKGHKRKIQQDKIALKRASIDLFYRKVFADGLAGWKIVGMQSSLKNHQLQGADFMKKRELAKCAPFGGLNCDHMGLGKTIMTIATMVCHPPGKSERNRCTLIVCPTALVTQWESELAKHAPGAFKRIFKHCSGSRLTGKGVEAVFNQADIVLTTYAEVSRSCPKVQIPQSISCEQEMADWWERCDDDTRDILHRTQWYRVVLDEASVIKNYKVHTSIACRALLAKHRWALSGTPIMNKLEEMYAYLKFLRVPEIGNMRNFQKHYVNTSDGGEKLNEMLQTFMLRRTHKDQFAGAPIIKLPKAWRRNIDVSFDNVERLLYEIVYRRFVADINEAAANDAESDDGLPRAHRMGIVAWMIMRQMVAHPFLAQHTLMRMLSSKHVDRIEAEMVGQWMANTRQDRDLITALRRMIMAKEEEQEEEKRRQENPRLASPSQDGFDGVLTTQLRQKLNKLREQKQFGILCQRILCQKCGDPPEDAVVTDCLHVYCQECLSGMSSTSQKECVSTCMSCGTQIERFESCAGMSELVFPGHDIIEEDLKARNKGRVVLDWAVWDNKVILSAKIRAARGTIETWLNEEPQRKIIVFSQFHMIMQLLGLACERKGWKHCNYNGKMSAKARTKSIKKFEQDPNMKIMIASLKCGGLGLNLTMASKVICVDLWFNASVEEQAFCRVFRIGQEHETTIARLIVQDSADTRLVDMQTRKQTIINQAMNDKKILTDMPLPELMSTFGDVQMDKGRPVITLSANETVDRILKDSGMLLDPTSSA